MLILGVDIVMDNKAMPDGPDKERAPDRDAMTGYARYTGVAFQMMAIIAGCAFIGYKIDQHFDHKVQWVTALACVIGVCMSIYQIVRQLKQ
jgi:F0F1-type ATP synthase assembly protein I